MAEECVQHIVHLLTKGIIHIVIHTHTDTHKKVGSLLRCLQPCRLPCGAGGAIWRPCFSSDSCQSPTTLQAKFRKQGVTFHSRRQLARVGLGGQTLIPSSYTTPHPAYASTPPFSPFTPLNHDFLCNVTQSTNLLPSPHTPC